MSNIVDTSTDKKSQNHSILSGLDGHSHEIRINDQFDDLMKQSQTSESRFNQVKVQNDFPKQLIQPSAPMKSSDTQTENEVRKAKARLEQICKLLGA